MSITDQMEFDFDQDPTAAPGGTFLPFPPGARTTDPETSKTADVMINAKRETVALMMLRAYAAALAESTDSAAQPDGTSVKGLTDEEAAERMSLLDSCYWKRASELRAMGFIETTGDTRLGLHGMPRIVCRITEEGERILRMRSATQDGPYEPRKPAGRVLMEPALLEALEAAFKEEGYEQGRQAGVLREAQDVLEFVTRMREAVLAGKAAKTHTKTCYTQHPECALLAVQKYLRAGLL